MRHDTTPPLYIHLYAYVCTHTHICIYTHTYIFTYCQSFHILCNTIPLLGPCRLIRRNGRVRGPSSACILRDTYHICHINWNATYNMSFVCHKEFAVHPPHAYWEIHTIYVTKPDMRVIWYVIYMSRRVCGPSSACILRDTYHIIIQSETRHMVCHRYNALYVTKSSRSKLHLHTTIWGGSN